MLIGVPREIARGERRVALVPDVVAQLTRAGHRVLVERGAGQRAGFTDEAYRAAGCDLADTFGRDLFHRGNDSQSPASRPR